LAKQVSSSPAGYQLKIYLIFTNALTGGNISDISLYSCGAKEKSLMNKTWKPVTAGILNIVSGAAGILVKLTNFHTRYTW
jgi:hypothetical protein